MFNDNNLNIILKELIHNHPNPISRIEIQKELGIQKKELIILIIKLKKEIKNINLNIVGINKNNYVKIEESEKLLLIQRKGNEIIKYNQMNYNQCEEYKKKIIVFSILYIEENITEEKLIHLLQNICTKEFINKLKEQKYLYLLKGKEEEEDSIQFGWRYKIEFSTFNPFKIIEEIEKSNFLIKDK